MGHFMGPGYIITGWGANKMDSLPTTFASLAMVQSATLACRNLITSTQVPNRWFSWIQTTLIRLCWATRVQDLTLTLPI